MKKITTLILTIISLTSFSQSIETITEKISDKICDCIKDDISSYSEIKPEFNRCYDKEFNQIFSITDSAEQKILIQQGTLEKIKNGIIPTLNNKCEKIIKVIESELSNSVEPAANNKIIPFPINFNATDFKKINKWKSKIVALNGEVIQVEKSRQNTPYSKLKIGDNEIWIISMVDSKFEKVGNKLRIVGYLIEIDQNDNEFERKIHKEKHHILAFGIVNLENKQVAYFPGSEMQIKEWMNGKIPSDGK